MQLSKLNERRMKNQSFRFAFIFSFRWFAWCSVPGGMLLIYNTSTEASIKSGISCFFWLPMGESEVICSWLVGWLKRMWPAVVLTCGDCNDGKCLNCKLYKTLMFCVRVCSFFVHIFFLMEHIFCCLNCGNMHAVVGIAQ